MRQGPQTVDDQFACSSPMSLRLQLGLPVFPVDAIPTTAHLTHIMPTHEISVPKFAFKEADALTKQLGLKTFLTGTDPELSKPTGGLGVVFRNQIQ
eukprot:6583014-Karenia_brevis.AAC.1